MVDINLEMPLLISFLNRLALPSLDTCSPENRETKHMAARRSQKQGLRPCQIQTTTRPIFFRMLRSYEKSDTTVSSDDITHEAFNFTVSCTDNNFHDTDVLDVDGPQDAAYAGEVAAAAV